MSLIIENEQVIQLSERDWVWLLKLLENSPPLNAKLKAARECYQQAKCDDADSSFNWQP